MRIAAGMEHAGNATSETKAGPTSATRRRVRFAQSYKRHLTLVSGENLLVGDDLVAGSIPLRRLQSEFLVIN
jgi:hypothetical protein